MNTKNKHVIAAIAIVILLGGSFYGGMRYAGSKAIGSGKFAFSFPQGEASGAQFGGRNGDGMAGAGGFQRGTKAGAGNTNFVNGEIISNDGKIMTVKLRDGGSKIILLSDTVEIGKFTAGTSADLEVGKTVTVTGKSNSDGSVTAQTVQMRPAMPTSGPQGAIPPAGN